MAERRDDLSDRREQLRASSTRDVALNSPRGKLLQFRLAPSDATLSRQHMLGVLKEMQKKINRGDCRTIGIVFSGPLHSGHRLGWVRGKASYGDLHVLLTNVEILRESILRMICETEEGEDSTEPPCS